MTHTRRLLRSVLASLAALAGFALFAPAASATGISLRWTNCVADGGTTNAAFACSTNTGFGVLVPSFTLGAPVADVGSIQGVVDVVSAGSALPAWWDLTGCRNGSLSAIYSVLGPVACQRWAPFLTQDGINSFVVGAAGPNTARITFSSIGSPVVDLATGVEYLATGLRINLNRTVGSPSCDGCLEGACLTLRGLTLTTATGTVELTLPGPTVDGAHVTWQGGGSGPGGTCAVATGARRSAWGAIKSLYR